MAVSASAFQRKFLLERVAVDRPGSGSCLSSSTSATPGRRASPAAHTPAVSAHPSAVSAGLSRTALHPGLASSAQHHVNGSAIGSSSRFSASSASPASACATELADSLSSAATARAAAAEALALARAAVAVAKEAAELSLSEEAMGLDDDGLPLDSSSLGSMDSSLSSQLNSPSLGWGEEEEEQGADEIMSSDQLRHMWLLAVDKVTHFGSYRAVDDSVDAQFAHASASVSASVSASPPPPASVQPSPPFQPYSVQSLPYISQNPSSPSPSALDSADRVSLPAVNLSEHPHAVKRTAKPIRLRKAAQQAEGVFDGESAGRREAEGVASGDAGAEGAHPGEIVMWAEDAEYHGLQRALEDGARMAEREAERKPKRVVVRSQKKGKRLAEREKALLQRQATSAAASAATTAAAAGKKKLPAEGPALALGEEDEDDAESAAEDAAAVAETFRRAANESVFAMFDTAGGNAKLLSAQEETDLSKGVQALLQLERTREALEAQLLRAPTRAEWAQAAGLTITELQARVAWGKECKQRMISSNMRLVISVAKKYTTRGLSLEELITEGCMGLLKGVEKFDHSKGFKFSTYAHWWIRQAISRSVAEQSRIVRLPAHVYELVSRINRAKAMLTDALGRAPADREVAQLVGITRGKLRSIMRTVRSPTSLDRPISSEDGDETLGAFVADTTLENPEDGIMQQLMRRDLENALHTLTPREKEVMWHRYGLDDGRVKTLEELGALFRVTRERVRQIEGKALMKLRQPGRSSALKSYVDGMAQ